MLLVSGDGSGADALPRGLTCCKSSGGGRPLGVLLATTIAPAGRLGDLLARCSVSPAYHRACVQFSSGPYRPRRQWRDHKAHKTREANGEGINLDGRTSHARQNRKTGTFLTQTPRRCRTRHCYGTTSEPHPLRRRPAPSRLSHVSGEANPAAYSFNLFVSGWYRTASRQRRWW
jgi:hypothetical protein